MRSTLSQLFGWVASVALVVAGWAALVDGFVAVLHGAGFKVALAISLVSASLGVIVGSAIAPFVAAVHVVAGGAKARAPWLAWLVILVAAFALLYLRVRPFQYDAALAYLAIVVLGAFMVTATVAFGATKPKWTGAVANGLLAVGGVGAVLWLGPENYPQLHDVVHVVALSAVASAFWPALSTVRASLSKSVTVIGMSALVCAATLLSVDRWAPQWRTTAVLHTELFNSFSAALHRAIDRDRDGFSPAFWGGDCDDSNDQVYPGAHDLPGGNDDNCNGALPQDAALPRSRGLAEPHGSASLPQGAIDRLILISIDTMRPELLRPDVMPNLYALAEKGARFSRAYPGGTCTQISLPLFHRPRSDLPSVIGKIVSAGIDAYSVPFQGRRGFPKPAARAEIDSDDERTKTEPGLRFLKAESTQPKYLWIHYKGLHLPYKMWPQHDTPPSVPPLHPAYVSEAMHLDDVLAPLTTWLTDPSRLARSMIVITSDHGEGMNEHGVKSHCHAAWEEITRVPAVVVARGVRPGVYSQLVTLRGLPATLLGAFGLSEEAEAVELFGRSWLRIIDAPEAPLNEFVVTRTSRRSSGRRTHAPVVAMVADRYKLVYGIEDQISELYDLKDDPGEQLNLATTRPDVVTTMRRRLTTMIDLDGFPGTVKVGR